MKLQISGVAICIVVIAVGCNRSTPESVVQKPKGANMVSSDLVFNVEGLT